MNPSRHLYVWDRLVLQLAPGLRNARHRHFGAFLLLAPDAPIEAALDHGRVVGQALLIGSNAWHRLDSRASRVATLLIGADHPWFGYVTPALNDRGAGSFDLSRLASNVEWNRLFSGACGCDEVHETIENILRTLSPVTYKPHVLDPKIAAVVQHLTRQLAPPIDLTDLANRVGLSAITLMRKFKRDLGVRIREYVLWRRLMSLIPLLDGHRTLTDAAQLAGFYDQAHLTRTARRMFDLQPSQVSDARITRIHSCGP